ncbi:MAG: hypothetical protein ACRDJ3_09005 [Solirubrobacteraceae bacterium]
MQTERDARITDWICRIGAAGVQHVARRFGMHPQMAKVRLRSLAQDGLLERHLVLWNRPCLYTATRAGLRWQGLSFMKVRHVKPGGFEHAWQMAQTAVDLHVALPGWEVLGEREIRAIECDNETLYGSAQIGQIHGFPQLRHPDLALVSPSGRVVPVEVELTNKGISRLTAICRGWGRARHIERLYYLAAPGVAPTVERAAKKANALDCITVLALEDTAGLVERELATECRLRVPAEGAIEEETAPAAQELAREEGTDARL